MENAFTDLAAQLAAEIEFEFEKGLIASVRSFRCLFATNHIYYHNTVQNKAAWQQISNCLKKSVLDCINRWYALVQTFLHYYQQLKCSYDSITWPHYEALLELQPYMVLKYTDLIQTQKPPIYYSNSTPIQRDTLLNELIVNRIKLLSPETPIGQVQNIWADIAEKLNAMGTRMPIIKWQRCWWEMKLKFGKKMLQIQQKQQGAVGTSINEVLSEEDMKIMTFCGANVLHSYSTSVCVVLDSNFEFGSDRDKPIPKCKKCVIFLNDLMFDLCDACRKYPNRCDICLHSYEQKLLTYQVKDWSIRAKSLLPSSYHSYAELSMCTNCSNTLQKEAAATWKICRICEKNHQALDNLFSNANEHLRDVFKKATNITFSECDGLPGYICNICKVQMQQFNNFYLRFCRAQCRLQEIHGTKFIHIEPPGEEEKATNAGKPKTYLLKRDSAGVPFNKPKEPPKGTYLLNPEISSGPVIATPPFNTLKQVIPIKGLTKLGISNKVAARRIVQTGPAPQRVYSTKARVVPVATAAGTTIPGVVPAKRMCIGPTNTKGVVSLQPVPFASQPGQANRIAAPPKPTTGVLTLQLGSSVATSSTQACALPAGHAPVPLFPTKNTGVTIAKRIRATQPAVFTISGDCQEDLPPAFCIPKSMNSVQLSMLPPASDEIPLQLPTIKTEKLDDGYPSPPNNNCSPSEVSSNASTASVECTNKAPIQSQSTNIKETLLDGSTAVLKPSQTTSDGFIPLSSNPQYAFHNAFLNANKDIFQPKKPKILPAVAVPIIETTTKKLATRKSLPVLNVTEEQRQQHQQQQPQSRVRKYWGPVDEFQITSVSEKTNSITKSTQPPAQVAATPSGFIRHVEVKKERVDNQPSMFYPDSFELNNVSLDADVSLMINTMMTKQEPIDDAESFKYINPSFLISYAEELSTEDISKEKNQEKDTSQQQAENSKSKKDTVEADKKSAPEETSSAEPAAQDVEVKNLRVKLKRSDRLRKLASRLRKKSSYQPPRSVPTRKSLRRLKSQKEKK